MTTIKCLFIGDVVGKPGMAVVQTVLPRLVEQHGVDATIVNGENSDPRGKGIGVKQVEFFQRLGVKLITSGNHVWDQRDFMPHFASYTDYLLRPANYPPACPGKGYQFINVAGNSVAIINLQGRVFMREDLDCPFRVADQLIEQIKKKTKVIFVDFHAEATSEKQALAFYLDGKISGIVGTHMHAQTADERVLPKGSGSITDLGYCGALDSALGIKKEIIINRFLTQMPQRFDVEKHGPMVVSGALFEVDLISGKTVNIERIRVIEQPL